MFGSSFESPDKIMPVQWLGEKWQRYCSFPPPPLSFLFCSRPIFCASKKPKSPFFALCATETLATQARTISTQLLHLSITLLPQIKCLVALPSFPLCCMNCARQFAKSAFSSSQKLVGAARHLIDSSKNGICQLSFELRVRILIKGVVMVSNRLWKYSNPSFHGQPCSKMFQKQGCANFNFKRALSELCYQNESWHDLANEINF